MNEIPKSSTSWTDIALWYFILQMPVGVLLFEHAWKASQPYRKKGQEKVHEKFPMFRRNDKPEQWSKLTFYPGVLLFLATRFFIILSTFIACCLLIQLVSLGHDFEKGPLTGWRRKAKNFVNNCGTRILIIMSGMRITFKKKHFDYTEYLGPNYEVQTKRFSKRVSTIVCNHTSWLDGYIMLNYFDVCLTPDVGFKSWPIAGRSLMCYDALFMPRARNDKDRENALKLI